MNKNPDTSKKRLIETLEKMLVKPSNSFVDGKAMERSVASARYRTPRILYNDRLEVTLLN